MNGEKTLVSLTIDAREIAEMLIENEGELNEELENKLELNSQQLAVKVDSYKLVLEQLEQQSLYWKSLKSQITTAEKSAKNSIESLKNRIKYSMKLLETNELKGAVFKAKKSRLKPKVKVISEHKVPSKYFREKIILEPDKEKILNDLLKGKQVDGCVLEEVETLRFYTAKG